MREDLKKIIEDNWEDIQALIIEKVEAEQKPKSIWDLDIEGGGEYYYVDSNGGVGLSYFDSVYDEQTREIRNAFLTREEAEFELERRKIEAIMGKHSGPFTMGKKNWTIVYYYTQDKVMLGSYTDWVFRTPYFESEEVAEKVIDEIGEDRLKKYWFGIKNDERRGK